MDISWPQKWGLFMKIHFTAVAFTFASFLMTSCGNESSKTNAQIDDSATVVHDDVTESLSEDTGSAEAASLSFSFDGASYPLTTFSRTCTDDPTAGTVSVVRTLDRTRTISKDNGKASFTIEMTDSGNVTRLWDKAVANITLSCSASDGHAVVPWTDSNLGGLKLDLSFNRTRTFSSVHENSKNKLNTRSRSFTAEGTRNIVFGAPVVSQTSITLTKTITSSSTRATEMTKKDGSKKSMSHSVSTKNGAPLVVAIERPIDVPKNWTSKIIKEGVLIAIDKNGKRIESTFNDVKFLSGNCSPVSGKISGEVFEKDATEASSSYVIEFGVDSEANVAIDGAKATKYSGFEGNACDLD